MSDSHFFFCSEDQFKKLIKECVIEVFLEFQGKVPYPAVPIKINENKILTRKQAATYLQVTANTVTRYVRQGKLLPAIINGSYRFFELDLINFLNSKKA